MHRTIRMLQAGTLAISLQAAANAAPTNVILFLGDGMGFEQIRAADFYFNGSSGHFNFESFSNSAAYTTGNASATTGLITDSAAAATALATGYKVENGNISIATAGGNDPRRATPSDGRDLLTILEQFSLGGRSTGLVTTSYMTDATPAAFAAHHSDRYDSAAIASDYFNYSRPNVLFGSTTPGFTVIDASAALYQTLNNRQQLLSLDTESTTHVAGVFETFGYAYDHALGLDAGYSANPYLWEMTRTALDVLDNDTDGFFLMVENELTDSSSHDGDLLRNVYEVRELERAIQQAIDWAAGRDDTLILVGADHETGSLRITHNNGAGALPSASYATGGHSTTPAPLFASGVNAHLFAGQLDNTDISRLIVQSTDGRARQTRHFQNGRAGYSATRDTHVQQAQANASHAEEPLVLVDGDDAADGGAQAVQGLIRFDDLFDATEIPAGAEIESAFLTLWTSNTTAGGVSLHRMLLDWSEQTTWLQLDDGIAPGIDAVASAETTLVPGGICAPSLFDVTATVQQWADTGGLSNFGWAILAGSDDGWQFFSSEYADDPMRRPALQITYVVPEPSLLAPMAMLCALASRRRI